MEPGLLLFAFAAGAAAFFAPCCIAMLPAYVGYALRSPPAVGARSPSRPALTRAGRGLILGGLAVFTLGALPLLAVGFSISSAFGRFLGLPLPSIDMSLSLTLVGLGSTSGGLFLTGKGPLAVRGALFGALSTLGFLVVFLAIGAPIAFLARWLVPYISWLAVFVGGSLVLLGGLMLAGKGLAPNLPMLKADVSSPRGFFAFGVGYGVASLSCTFPVFLAVLASATLSGGFVSASMVFAAYALGKASLLVGVTILTVAGGASLGSQVKRLTPYMQKASALILMVAGAYVAYYFGRYAPGIA